MAPAATPASAAAAATPEAPEWPEVGRCIGSKHAMDGVGGAALGRCFGSKQCFSVCMFVFRCFFVCMFDLGFHLPCLRVGWRASRVLHMPVLEVGRETMPLPSDGIHELYDNARSLLSKGCVHKVAMLIHWFAHKPTPHTQTCSAGPRDSNARGHVTQVGCRCCSASSTAKCLHVLRDSGR